MRIMINIDEGKDANKRKAIRVRTNYYFSGDDSLRVRNCGVEIYGVIKEGFGQCFEGGVIQHEGERK